MTTINEKTIDAAQSAAQVAGSAQAQWFSRPADERFASVEDLLAHVQSRRERSYEVRLQAGQLQAANGSGLRLLAPRDGEGKATPFFGGLAPTHYAFNQLASRLRFGASELRKLSDRTDLVVDIVNHLAQRQAPEGLKLMAVEPADYELAEAPPMDLVALTGEDYGRIWDVDVVAAAQQLLARTEGRFFAPLDWSRQKRSLFAGDRDVFMFFCDGGSIVDGGGDRDQLHRGFYVWNSEVGARAMGIATFLFRAVCGNFGIWGHEDVRVVKIRHTSGGPERFVTEAVPALNEFVHTSAKPLEERVRKAKAYALPAAPDAFLDFFRARGFTAAETKRAMQFADVEEGGHETLWLMHNGFTAAARHVAYADAALDLQTRAGKLMDLTRG